MTSKIFRNALFQGLVVLLCCTGLFFAVLYNYVEEQIFDALRTEAGYIIYSVEYAGEGYLKDLKTEDRITHVAADGHVLFDSVANAQNMENHIDREEIVSALETGTGQSAHFSNTLFEKTLYYAQRMGDGTVLRVSCTQNTAAAMLQRLVPLAGWIVAFILLLSVLLSYRLAKKITDPINAIALDNPNSENIYPELRPLVARLQAQNRTIRQQMDEQSIRQREFLAITNNMSEGFLLVDENTNVLSGNHSAMQILHAPPGAAIKNLRQSTANPEICGVVETALAGVRAEILLNVDARTFQTIASPVISDGHVTGAVVIVMDVTEREQREALRREFSANVSHELKTPLTSISGFAELMKEGLVPKEKMQEFSNDIYRESQRLMSLINDTINLSQLDEDAQLLEREMVDLYELAEHILANLQHVAQQHKVSLHLMGEHAQISGVRQLLSEMIYNLCDNAIKYNKVDGRVTVCIQKGDLETRLSVSDTGIGIPYAHQSRVFERFYRVDKSHSKEIGGTGLGLSIVKHGAQYHGARVELQSEPNHGTTISILFRV